MAQAERAREEIAGNFGCHTSRPLNIESKTTHISCHLNITIRHLRRFRSPDTTVSNYAWVPEVSVQIINCIQANKAKGLKVKILCREVRSMSIERTPCT